MSETEQPVHFREEEPKMGSNKVANFFKLLFVAHTNVPIESSEEDSTWKDEKEKENAPTAFEEDTTSSDESLMLEFTDKDVNDIVVTKDIDQPCNTIRMWVIAVVLASVLGAVDAFFILRFPSVHIGAIVAQLLAFPLGNLWYMVVPDWNIGVGKFKARLNPGPFNQKEHTLIYIFANTVTSAKLVNISIAEQIKFFKINYGVGRAILFNLSSFLMSWGWAGLSYPILVRPAQVVWPGVLSACALMQTLHSSENAYVKGWKMSRFRFFAYVFVFSFVWYWFSDLIFPFVANLGAFPTWAALKNRVVGQVFGTSNGLAILPLSFDWATISTLSNPLTVPFLAAATIFGSFVFWVWCVIPGLYYKNHWQTAHMPILTNAIFNVNGTTYTPNKVVNKEFKLDLQKYAKYSPVMIPIGFLMNTALTLAAFASMMVTLIFRFKTDIWGPITGKTTQDYHNVMMAKYKGVPAAFFIALILVSIGLGIAFTRGWNQQMQLDVGGYFVSVILGAILFVPVCLVEAQSTLVVSLQAFFNLIGALWYKGEPLAVLYFMNFGFSSLQHAEHMAQGAKLSHYQKVPIRATMVVLLAAGIWAALLNSGVTVYLLNHIHDVCTPEAKNHMTCKSQQTSFNQHLMWGLFGSHIFTSGGRYSWILWFFLVGAGIAAFVHTMEILRPNQKLWKRINPALIVSGASQIPTATGLNYGSWFVVAFAFNFWIHRFNHPWWKKYNLVTAVGLDCGVAIAGILVYFCITYTGASSNYHWWATEVVSTGCDANACPYLPKKMTNPGKW